MMDNEPRWTLKIVNLTFTAEEFCWLASMVKAVRPMLLARWERLGTLKTRQGQHDVDMLATIQRKMDDCYADLQELDRITGEDDHES